MSDEVFLIDGARTPQGRYGGALASVRPDDLAALVVGEAVRRAGIAPEAVDEVILGAANQAGEDNRDVARMAVLLAGLPHTVPGYTVNRLCASGLTAVASAAQAIRSGEASVVVAGGVESMTRAPWVMAKPGTPWAKPGEVHDTSLGWRFTNPRFTAADDAVPADAGPDTVKVTLSMGETAEEVAALDGITRAESDAFALRSHRRAVAAREAGRFDREIVPVPVRDGEVVRDEGPRPDTTPERLAGLRTIFRANGIVTAGNASPLSDGASALVVASGAAVRRFGLVPRARIVTSASAGVPPQLMGLGPVPATEKALARAGLAPGDLDAVELNEAFAAQALAVIRRLELDEEKVNADGGAIALGHPLGSSGARILLTLVGRLEREGGRRGLATLCVGVGQGVAMLVERV
ncbi:MULTISPECIES: thiolase family protein [Streptomyces]|uniref:Probable acetyl-CoA acetyltransferase n=1 Tax=Streptomyces tsukubensis (strain DSM 42081 / NBRC 108919 / NRRL 18488 / 9993) TaxID=1114943 RepID=I2NAF1_STRT9|nr:MULTISPECIES: thiolase family protein [Streptomyces]AZK97804.1 beta-ketoadipyl CoA thiolase [Streptomyces tsukubensis]EIF93998.1 beta-ketoadipyl CoA thiolase [Streptomyces tsukubensis NRRL18488]MYS63221.1 acetyl-CoA C-acyltransferase [Streptomyces sp. SID5473]QKM66269.1 acetyl-CoA C-acyltransferase [Streptomyces tsukubensis NRRL18488]TAI45393.1 thiolase family protein [Streptomyces tsukubensis]